MKKKLSILFVFLILAAVAGSLAGCYAAERITGSQNIETREFDYADFDKVEVGSAIEVEIKKSENFQVSITASDNIFDYIEHSLVGDELSIRLKPLFSFRNIDIRVEITMPELSSLELSGACSGEVVGFHTDGTVDFYISGASKLNIISLQSGDTTMEISGASKVTGYLKTEGADFKVSGASSLELDGSADGASLEASGASKLKLKSFYILHASVRLSGASSGDIEVNGKLDIDISGASRLTFGGNPTLDHIAVSGASTINRR